MSIEIPNEKPRSGGLNPALWLVVGLPASAVIAGLLTVWIAMSHSWTPEQTTVDRFGNPIAASQPRQPKP